MAASRSLTAEEWDEKQSRYEEMVSEIIIPSDINETIIKDLIGKIDRVLKDAHFDYSRAKISYEIVQRSTKTLKAELFLRAKAGQVPELGAKPSDEVSKSWAEVALRDAADPSPVWVENEAARRFSFMQAIINILTDKRQMLITDQGVLKLEASL